MALPEVSKYAVQSALGYLRRSYIVSNRQSEHTHSGNVAIALARKAVGDMKTKMTERNATSSSSQLD